MVLKIIGSTGTCTQISRDMYISKQNMVQIFSQWDLANPFTYLLLTTVILK